MIFIYLAKQMIEIKYHLKYRVYTTVSIFCGFVVVERVKKLTNQKFLEFQILQNFQILEYLERFVVIFIYLGGILRSK